MAVGPIEVIRAQEATQIRHVDSQRAQHAEEQISRNFQELIKHEHYKPSETSKAGDTEYRYDAKEKGNSEYHGSGGKKRNKEEEKKESNKPKNTPKSGGFDVLI